MSERLNVGDRVRPAYEKGRHGTVAGFNRNGWPQVLRDGNKIAMAVYPASYWTLEVKPPAPIKVECPLLGGMKVYCDTPAEAAAFARLLTQG